MLENDITKLLLTDSGVQAAMSNASNVYMGAIPKGQPDTPAVVLRVNFNETFNTAGGPVNLKRKRLQFDSYSKRYTDTVTISAAIRTLLASMSAAVTDLDSTTVYGILLQNEMDLPEEPGDSGYVLRRTFLADFFYAE
jgi:hypothetical protein